MPAALRDDPYLGQSLVEVDELPVPDHHGRREIIHLQLPQNVGGGPRGWIERKQERIAVDAVDSNEDRPIAADDGSAAVEFGLALDLPWCRVVEHPF